MIIQIKHIPFKQSRLLLIINPHSPFPQPVLSFQNYIRWITFVSLLTHLSSSSISISIPFFTSLPLKSLAHLCSVWFSFTNQQNTHAITKKTQMCNTVCDQHFQPLHFKCVTLLALVYSIAECSLPTYQRNKWGEPKEHTPHNPLIVQIIITLRDALYVCVCFV